MRRSFGLSARDLEGLRRRLDGVTVSFGVPAYNEGRGVIPTLESIRVACQECDLASKLTLSDSSDDERTAEAASAWAAQHPDVHLRIDRSKTRRSLKEANNVLMAQAETDLLIVLVGDATLPPRSLLELLFVMTDEPRPSVGFGCSYPDPSSSGSRASRWQMKVVHRHAMYLPKDAPRADGVLWAAWRDFFATYRFPVGSGSLHDDEELKRHLVATRTRMANVASAVAYKVPAGSLEDFKRQTERWFQVAEGTIRRDRTQIRAALREALEDPIGAAAYGYARARLGAARGSRTTYGEKWEVTYTAKRDRIP